jgi:hypothetical protein
MESLRRFFMSVMEPRSPFATPIFTGVLVGVYMIFLPQTNDISGDAPLDQQAVLGLIASVVLFCLLYRHWPDSKA